MNEIATIKANGRKRRGHSRFISIFLLILISLSGLIWGAYEGLRRSDLLIIKEIRITGNEYIGASTIYELLNEFIGLNLLNVSEKDISNELIKIKRIKTIRVRRLFPSTLLVKVSEKKGFLYIKSKEGDLFPVDTQGMVIEYVLSQNQEDLPIVHSRFSNQQLEVGSYLKDAFIAKVMKMHKKIMEERPDFIKSISEYYQEGNYTIIVDARNGTRILLGDDRLSDQLRRYQFVQDNGNVDRKQIFDLRFKNQVIVRPEVQ